MSDHIDQTETAVSSYVPPLPYTPPEQSAGELRAQELMTGTTAIPVAEPETDVEPSLNKVIRFEAGTVHDLLAHIKEWIEWRMAGGKSVEPVVVPVNETRDDTLRRLDLPPLATQTQINDAEANHPAGLATPEATERRATAERLSLPADATQAQIDAAQVARDEAAKPDVPAVATADSGATKIGGGAVVF